VTGYSADPQQSRLEFVGVQAGAEFKGTFHKFSADIGISAPDALASSRFDVQIDLKSVDSMDKDRGTTIRGSDIFDVAHYPRRTTSPAASTKTAAGYTAIGALTLRGGDQRRADRISVHAGGRGPRNSKGAPSSSAWISGPGKATGRAPSGWPTP